MFTDYIVDLNFPGEDITGQTGVKDCSSCVGRPCGLNGNCLSQPDMTFQCKCFGNFVSDLCQFKGNLRRYVALITRHTESC